jgi:hypothetical protein
MNTIKKKSPLSVDELLRDIQPIQEAETDHFFYTRLRARMEKRQSAPGWNFPLRPVWVIASLVLLLLMNSFILAQQFKSPKTTATTSSPLQNFATSYDQTISSSY